MKNVLIVVDMQNDFVSGSLGTAEARAIVPAVREKIARHEGRVIFTQDTHRPDYLATQEGRNLPVEHCVKDTWGWQIVDELQEFVHAPNARVIEKPTFGSTDLAALLKDEADEIASVELIGLCTDICVVSNALLIKATLPEIPMAVDSACCAGVTPEKHLAALETLRSCQVAVK